MGIFTLVFQTAEGGINADNALSNDSNLFGLEYSRTDPNLGIIILSNTTPQIATDFSGIVSGITVNIFEAGNAITLNGSPSITTFKTALWHSFDGEYTESVTQELSNIQQQSATTISIGGGSAGSTWGKTWAWDTINNIKVRFFDPVHNGDATKALIGAYVNLTINYIDPSEGSITIPMGKIEITKGKITI